LNTPLPARQPNTVTLLGFGEAGMAFAKGWRSELPELVIRAFDLKTDSKLPAIAARKWQEYSAEQVKGGDTLHDALSGAAVVFSLVTAGNAHEAACAAAQFMPENALFFDCNSCAPETKKASATVLEAAGMCYVDIAVMSPIHPKCHQVPLLVSGAHTAKAIDILASFGMKAKQITGGVGAASSVKMMRSVMIKGLEALTLECFLAARKAGVEQEVLETLDSSFPGWNWAERGAYNFERSTRHGIRRAEEMHEVAKTVANLGLSNGMSQAAADWQRLIGELGVMRTKDEFNTRADAILNALDINKGKKPMADKEYDDIPGTYVFDADRSRKGYHLNMFCSSLRLAKNREAMQADPEAYLAGFPMTEAQRQAVRGRDWNGLLALGGSIYYTSKLAAFDKINFQDLAAMMTGVTRDEYRDMMLSGGRPIEGNRYKSEWEDK